LDWAQFDPICSQFSSQLIRHYNKIIDRKAVVNPTSIRRRRIPSASNLNPPQALAFHLFPLAFILYPPQALPFDPYPFLRRSQVPLRLEKSLLRLSKLPLQL